jgi:hypothetical protein
LPGDSRGDTQPVAGGEDRHAEKAHDLVEGGGVAEAVGVDDGGFGVPGDEFCVVAEFFEDGIGARVDAAHEEQRTRAEVVAVFQ